MFSSQPTPADAVASQRDAFIRFFLFASGTLEFCDYIGDRLGLYRAWQKVVQPLPPNWRPAPAPMNAN